MSVGSIAPGSPPSGSTGGQGRSPNHAGLLSWNSDAGSVRPVMSGSHWTVRVRKSQLPWLSSVSNGRALSRGLYGEGAPGRCGLANCPAGPETCANGCDDDLDGRTDCSDADCFGDRECLAIMPEDCDDGMDNDADSLIDLADWDCPRAC